MPKSFAIIKYNNYICSVHAYEDIVDDSERIKLIFYNPYINLLKIDRLSLKLEYYTGDDMLKRQQILSSILDANFLIYMRNFNAANSVQLADYQFKLFYKARENLHKNFIKSTLVLPVPGNHKNKVIKNNNPFTAQQTETNNQSDVNYLQTQKDRIADNNFGNILVNLSEQATIPNDTILSSTDEFRVMNEVNQILFGDIYNQDNMK